MCETLLPGEAEVETIDVLLDRAQADEFRILTTPTVVLVAPLPRRCATGDLHDAAQVLAALALHPTHQAP